MSITIPYQIKAALLWYWRYKRGCIVATESCVSWWMADVLAYRDGIVYEIEIKMKGVNNATK